MSRDVRPPQARGAVPRRTFGARRVTRAALILLVALVVAAGLAQRDHRDDPGPSRQPEPVPTTSAPAPGG